MQKIKKNKMESKKLDTRLSILNLTKHDAEVVKLVDALDSKSSEPCVRAGSIPAFGTIYILGGVYIEY